ncbi:MAG TPA: GntR family transcriptional regulator [Rubrobacter sp.]|nr:GntR family transcriptional regulator [Rubrobacter sp.]
MHLQLEQQIKHLIMTGGFKVGDRLPSIRAMAGFLRINRNTVARVFTDLEREGFVESRRGSGMYVLEPPVDAVEMKEDVLDRVIDLCAAQGLPVADVAYALLARSGAEPREKTKILFVECTREELDQFSDELEAQLPVDVERVLLEDLPARLLEDGEPPWALAVTTFFHVHEVQELMEPLGVETVALLAEANLESLRRLTELPAGTTVGVVGWGRTCMENLSRSLEGAGLDHLDFVQSYVDQDAKEAIPDLQGARAVVCASRTARRLKELGVPSELEIIEEDRTLDKGGVEMLGRMLREARPATP